MKRAMPSPATAVSPLKSHLGFWLRFVSNHVSQAFRARLAARGVAVAEWVVLRELLDEPGGAALPSALADRLGMTRGAASKIAAGLEEKSLVSRRPDAADGRRSALAITARGRALVPALARLADENDAEFFGHLPARERERIAAAMREVVRRRGLRATPVE